MQKLTVNLQNCYGIKKLQTEFDFSDKKTFLIYAPNGVMKTSLAKTFKDLSNNKESRDQVFPERKTTRNIQDENGEKLLPEEVFVIEPYNEQFKSDKLSTLLVKKELKDKYEEIYKDLEDEKINFIKKLKNISQSTDCEDEFISAFKENQKETFFDLLCKLYPIINNKYSKYDFKYNDIFDKKGNVKKFLEKHRDSLDIYIKNYELIISGSNFFKKSDNSFGTYQASEILKSVSDGSFFEAGHSLKLSNNEKINSIETFEKIVEDEIKKIVEDVKLKDVFEKIDKAIGLNAELRAFKKAIEQNNLLLIELKNYEDFKKKVLLNYLNQLKDDVNALLTSFESKKQQLKQIIAEAFNTITNWEKAVREFNERFHGLPFKLEIQNKEDAILRINEPSVGFVFQDSGEEKSIERQSLLEVLSQGERRSLYLLNIIFEVEARKKLNQKTLFIIDDIADSFDYKNKYAIIEYLKDISKDDNFFQIILTHNFDFFRCVSGRIIGNNGSDRKYKLNVIKNKEEIKLIVEKYQNNPFIFWKNNLHNDSMLIASIPFVRNLAEYSGYDEEFLKLTSLLHNKPETSILTICDLEKIFKSILKDKSELQLTNKTKKVMDLIFELADKILFNTTEIVELENKIVLSIAIRIKAEQFMIKQINDQNFVNQITKNQTVELIKKYIELFKIEIENIKLLEQVNLMTPENIHINSFMYEPILDMSIDHLKSLYSKIKNK